MLICHQNLLPSTATKYQLYRELRRPRPLPSAAPATSTHGHGDLDRDRSRSKRPKTAAPSLKAKAVPQSRPKPQPETTTIDTSDFTAAKRAVTGHAAPAAGRGAGPAVAADPGPIALAEAATTQPTLSREELARFKQRRASAAVESSAAAGDLLV